MNIVDLRNDKLAEDVTGARQMLDYVETIIGLVESHLPSGTRLDFEELERDSVVVVVDLRTKQPAASLVVWVRVSVGEMRLYTDFHVSSQTWYVTPAHRSSGSSKSYLVPGGAANDVLSRVREFLATLD